MEIAAWLKHLAQLAVHAKTHHGMVISRFDVDVACSLAKRLHNHPAHQIHDGAAVRQRLYILEIHVDGLGVDLHRVHFHVGRNGIDLEIIFVASGQDVLDSGSRCKNGANPRTGDPLQFVDPSQILRIRHGHGQRVPHLEHGHGVHRFGGRSRDQFDVSRIEQAVAKANSGHAQVSADKRQDRLVIDEAHFLEQLAQTQVLALLLAERRFQLLLCEQPSIDKLLAQARRSSRLPARRHDGRGDRLAAGLGDGCHRA